MYTSNFSSFNMKNKTLFNSSLYTILNLPPIKTKQSTIFFSSTGCKKIMQQTSILIELKQDKLY